MHTSIDTPAARSALRIMPTATGSDFETSLAQAALRRVEAKELLFVEGDPVSHVYRVETGAIALYRVLADGRRQVVGFAYPGDIVGLGIEGEHVMNAQAVKPTRLRCLPVSALRQAVANEPMLGFKLYQALSRELAAARDLMLTTGQRSAMERVASFLMSLSRRRERTDKDPASFELPMSRTDIGDFLGLTIETVSRTFSKFKTMNLIALPRCNQVILLDAGRLARIANGDHTNQT